MSKAEILLRKDSSKWAEEKDPTRQFVKSQTSSNLVQRIDHRIKYFNHAILRTLQNARVPLEAATKEITEWIKRGEIVRVIGAGRARLAAAIPANRLHHAGARVYVIHDTIPLPNTYYGGAIIAASASGRTPDVLDIMKNARERNSNIRILGIACESAQEFRQLCDIFIPIDERFNPYPNPLRALADTSEHIISELLDAIIVAASIEAGLTDEDFRRGHEDLGPTGPYRPLHIPISEMATSKEIESNFIRLLSIVRHDKFSAEFLRFCYKLLGGENGRNFETFIAFLVRENHLVVDAQSSLHRLIDNDELLNPTLTDDHLHGILIKVYQGLSHGDIESAAEMVYHAICCNDYDSAYGVIFNSGNLELWYNQGLSHKLILILEQFRAKIGFFEHRRQALILLAKAEAYSNISMHHDAVKCLMEAYEYLPSVDVSKETQQIRRIIWKLAGISSGDMGNTHDAMGFYRRAIEDDPSCNHPSTTLCMGYLGYLYLDHQEFQMAHDWVSLSLEYCPEYRDPHVYCKNLTNLALVKLFTAHIEQSLNLFEEALTIANRSEKEAGGDIRERARILCHMGLSKFAMEDSSDALMNHCEAAETVCKEAQDKRRYAIAIALKGIVKIQNGLKNDGVMDLKKAIEIHVSINDVRNALFESLSLMYLMLPSEKYSEDDFYRQIQTGWNNHGVDVFNLNKYILDKSTMHLSRFWWNCIKPIISNNI